MKKKGNLVIYLLPYLFIDKEIDFDGFKLKPSYKEIFDKESTRVKSHIAKLAKSFRYWDTNSINQYTYGTTTVHNETEWIKLKYFLDKFSTLLRYQELSDDKNGANYSNFDYAVFEIYKPMGDIKMLFYNGVINGKTSITIHYPETKFCPNHPLRPYIVHVEKESILFRHLYFFSKSYHSDSELKRIIRSLEWFNKSFKSDPEVDDFERYTNIAIAFEALFNSPEEAIQSTLSAEISALLGETDEMKHWVKDFYSKRSSIVHGKEEPSTLYRGKNSNEFHLDHINYSRKIFTRSLKAIFISREQVYTQDLHSELISNERRINEIIAILKKKLRVNDLYISGTFNTIESLSQRDITGKIQTVRLIGVYLLPYIKSLLSKNKDKEMLNKLNYIVINKETDQGKLALVYSEFHQGFHKYYFEDNIRNTSDLQQLLLNGAIYTFSSFASWKLFNDAFNSRK